MQHSPFAHDDQVGMPRRAAAEIDALINKHSALVRRIAWHVHSRLSSATEIEDLIQIGMATLVECARVFEERGIAFAPYATMRVRGAMIDELRRNARMSRAGMANRRQLAATRSRLENDLGRSAADSEMAKALGVDGAAYHTLLTSSCALREDSIDEAYSDDNMWFADMGATAETAIEQAQQSAMLAAHISQLNPREATILQLYFAEEMNLEEIGETLSIGAARVCQIKKAALDKLRAMMVEA